MNGLLQSINISTRLYINMLMSLLMLVVVGFAGWASMTLALDNSNTLNHDEHQLVQPVADFQRHYSATLQAMNDYVITMNEQRGQAFNQQIDQLRTSLAQLLNNLGADAAISGDGLLELKDTGSITHPDNIKELFAIDNVLFNLKKATNSSIFLRNNMLSTFNFGLESNAKRLAKDLQQLASQRKAGIMDAISEFDKKIGYSQIQAAKLVTSLDTKMIDDIRHNGLGDGVEPYLKQFTEAFGEEALTDMNKHRDDYLESLADLRDFAKTIVENNQSLSQLSGQGASYIQAIADRIADKRSETFAMMAEESAQSRYELAAVILFATVLGLIVTMLTVKSIVSPLHKITANLTEMARTGRFNHPQTISGNNELTQMQTSLESMMQSIRQAMDEVHRVSHAMSQGDLSHTMTANYRGDLAELAESFNSSLLKVRDTLNDLQAAAVALEHGKLDYQINIERYAGQYLSVVNSIDRAITVQEEAIEDVRRVTRAMREGDFSQRISVDMPGELHNLKRYLNEALNRLEDAINQKAVALQHFSMGDFSYVMPGEYSGKLLDLKQNMGKMAQSVSSMLSDVQLATSHAVSGIKEISAGNQDLNRRVQKQAVALARTTQHMQAMSDSVKDTLSQSEEVSNNTSQMRTQSRSGIDIVNQMLSAMEQIQEASQSVSSITEVINGISFQTNLLALNAAVEAARAGEAGRGFAVVAGEVRALAQKTAEASRDIQQVTETNLQRIEEGLLLSRTTHDVFSESAQAIERIFNMTEKMTLALNRQSEGIIEVSQALEDIDASTQQNASMVEQIASTSDNIISEVLMLEERMEQFRLLAQDGKAANDHRSLVHVA